MIFTPNLCMAYSCDHTACELNFTIAERGWAERFVLFIGSAELNRWPIRGELKIDRFEFEVVFLVGQVMVWSQGDSDGRSCNLDDLVLPWSSADKKTIRFTTGELVKDWQLFRFQVLGPYFDNQ